MNIITAPNIVSFILLLAAIVLSVVTNIKISKYNRDISKLKDYESELELFRRRIKELNDKLRCIQDNNDKNEKVIRGLYNSFYVNHEDLVNCINKIGRNYSVSNKDKKMLMKVLNQLLMVHHSSIKFDDIKENKLSVSQNIKILKKYYIEDYSNKNDFENEKNVPGALMSLILYIKKS